MKTPISDFVSKYADSDITRFHMPGHKGKSFLGCESLDITEIDGADVLYSCNGIIKESEDNLSSLFGTAHSFYSTEGSTLCIKAMLALVTLGKKNPLVLAARNIHKAFCYAAALLDIDVEFIYSSSRHLCSCELSCDDVEKAIDNCTRKPDALYLTSPDYLGHIQNIEGIAKVCKEKNIPLLVDNAHGAYLKFLPESRHPIDLGATICCDSAHKTLPVLTGGAYLHISKDAPKEYTERAREMLSLFASTSPSYLIMQSLDICNRYLTEDYRAKLLGTVNRIEHCKAKICNLGYHIKGSEPLKIVIECAEAEKLSAHLREYKVECEFADERYLVLMAGTENTESDFVKLEKALECYKGCREASKLTLPIGFKAKKIMSIREAMLSASEIVPLSQALGRVCATPTVSCPPAVPIVISGEEITAEAVDLFDRYGITSISVVQDG